MKFMLTRILPLLLLALVAAGPSAAQSPAKLAPADTTLFVHIDNPSGWFDDLADGKIGEEFRKQIEENSDLAILLKLLQMDFDQFMAGYFAEELVVIGSGNMNNDDGQGPSIVFTKVAPAQREHAIASFKLKRAGQIAESPMYVTEDGSGFFVMMKDWVGFCDVSSVDYLHAVLEADPISPTLADTEAYKYWTGLLPEDRAATLLMLNGQADSHAVGVTRSGKLLDMTYLGKSADFDGIDAMLGEAEIAEFGPLPADTLAAMSFNLKMDGNSSNEIAEWLNLLASPASFSEDILPKLDTPTLMFLGSTPGQDIGLKVDLPVAGIAVKMKDPSAAADMQAMLDRLVFLGNTMLAQQELEPMPFKTVEYEGCTMRIAEVGKTIAPVADWPELEPIQLVYGTIGDYYVVCTQETFFKQCVDANAGGKQLRIRDQGPAHPLATSPIMVMTARPDGMGQMLRSWMPLVESGELADILGSGPMVPGTIAQFKDFIQLLQQYSTFKMELWRGEDGLIIGRGQLLPPL